MLNAILSPEREYRYHSYDAHWASAEEMASMSNGSGDEYSIVFSDAGVYIRGFDHESPMSPWAHEDGELWPGVIDAVPEVFQAQMNEPAFMMEGTPSVTACLWRTTSGIRWCTGEIEFPDRRPDPDGADWLFALLTDRSAGAYRSFASDYFETKTPLDAIEHVYALRPLSDKVVQALNPKINMVELVKDITEIGYPNAPVG
ncbi:hypothetical protein ACFQX6_25965 [Streptosporangium lutulentum]